MAYGLNVADLFRRAATYVDRILNSGHKNVVPTLADRRSNFR
jgi:hypothetical protein